MKTALISVSLKKISSEDETSFEELGRLAETAGLETVLKVRVKVQEYSPATLIGSGKLEEIAGQIKKLDAGIAVFDRELTPAQQRNITEVFGAEVIDRTRLIIEIFAQRAGTREGKLQAKLAGHTYDLSRLAGKGAEMDQQHGMIGGRGAGERKIEYNKRILRKKIYDLQREIDTIREERRVQRARRDSVPMPQITLVGYTNAGKSTLLNFFTGNKHGIYADDKLFATLDPSTKRVRLPSGGNALFTDTVGFIQKLPHNLVAAFRATLEEIKYSDIILHVHDISSPEAKMQHAAVTATLKELGIKDIPVINVFNKCDGIRGNPQMSAWAPDSLKPAFISALTGQGTEELLRRCEISLGKRWAERTLRLPAGRGDIIREIYASCLVKEIKYGAEITEAFFRATPENYSRICFMLSGKGGGANKS